MLYLSAAMDVYDLRREIIARVIKTRYAGNQADFGGVTKLSASYVTRMLKPQTEKTHKKIGEAMARRLEAVEDLGLEPNELLDPKPAGRSRGKEPAKPDFSKRTPTKSDWAILDDIRVLPHDEQEALKARLHAEAEKYRAYRDQVIEQAKDG